MPARGEPGLEPLQNRARLMVEAPRRVYDEHAATRDETALVSLPYDELQPQHFSNARALHGCEKVTHRARLHERIPDRIRTGGPSRIRILQCFDDALELARAIERRIDQHEAATLG